MPNSQVKRLPDLARLRRYPDLGEPELVAVDATDRLLLDHLATDSRQLRADDVVTMGDRFGALTIGAAALTGPGTIRSYQDSITSRRALAANAERMDFAPSFVSLPLGPELLAGARLVLLQLPKSLTELDELADSVARYAHPEVRLLAGGRVKHMTHAMTTTLEASFASVSASLARQKSRLLNASGPRVVRPELPFPRQVAVPELDLTIASHGGVFAHDRLDIGTRFLLDHSADIVEDIAVSAGNPNGQENGDGPQSAAAATLVDLGCGTGIMAAVFARLAPQARIVAADSSAAAVSSAALTTQLNGLQVEAIQDDALDSLPTASVDVIVCNPPFHLDQSVHTGAAMHLASGAARALRPGGVLWTVYNSHLKHRAHLDRIVGPTSLIAQNSKFTITRSVRIARI